MLLTLGLTVAVDQNCMAGRYEQHLFKLRRKAAKEQIESEIRLFLRNETFTFGANDSVDLEKIVFE